MDSDSNKINPPETMCVLIEAGLVLGVYSTFGLASNAAANYADITPDKLLPWKKDHTIVEEWTSRGEHFLITKLKIDDSPFLDIRDT